ncbi:MAG: ECF transporter S component [Thermodesulfobacteriota bacterium]|nr:ECF transporter S component [Thermodesulfobacteriota bacterium]
MMDLKGNRFVGIVILTLLYPMIGYWVHIPNPMLPGAVLALNMIFPVLAGYFYGPGAGAMTGGLGTALSSLLTASLFDGLAIFPHAVMGLAAGWVGKNHSAQLTALTIILGHALNIIFFLRFEMIDIQRSQVFETILGLTTETIIDIVAIVLIIMVLKLWQGRIE